MSWKLYIFIYFTVAATDSNIPIGTAELKLFVHKYAHTYVHIYVHVRTVNINEVGYL